MDLINYTSGLNATAHIGHHSHGLTVALWNFEYVRDPFVIAVFIFALIIFKVAYEHLPIVAKHIPESCILILLGIIIGALMLLEKNESTLQLVSYKPKSFFLYLLPPIILECAYSLRDRAFVKQIGPVLLFAVVGTILNMFILAPILFGIYKGGAMGSLPNLTFLDCLVFSALIAAVDPVAVLAIFQEVGVNKALYFMVFGEALLNDAVTIVVYRVVLVLRSLHEVAAKDIGLGVAAFFCVSFGAIAIGSLMGILTAIITRFTSKLRILEPPILYVMAYLAYLLAEMVEFSGIISMICCVYLQCQYAAENIAPKSFLTVTYFAKAASNITESVIFIIVGVMVIQSHCWEGWQTGFALWALLFMIIVRFIVVYALTSFLDMAKPKPKQIKWQEQFLIAYGGLRGAISFSLAFTMNSEDPAYKNLILSTTFLIIFFTIFVQDLNRWTENHCAEGIEVIVGDYGHHYLSDMVHYINRLVVRKYLQNKSRPMATNFLMKYQTVALRANLSSCNLQYEDCKCQMETNMNRKYSHQDLKLLDQTRFPATFAETYMDAQAHTIDKNRRQTLTAEENQEQVDKFRTVLRSTLYPNSLAHYRKNDASLKHLPRSDSHVMMVNMIKQHHFGLPKRFKHSHEINEVDDTPATGPNGGTSNPVFSLHDEAFDSDNQTTTDINADTENEYATLSMPMNTISMPESNEMEDKD